MLGLDSDDVKTPSGMRTFKSKLEDDQNIKQIIDNNKIQTGRGHFVFRPKLWKRI